MSNLIQETETCGVSIIPGVVEMPYLIQETETSRITITPVVE